MNLTTQQAQRLLADIAADPCPGCLATNVYALLNGFAREPDRYRLTMAAAALIDEVMELARGSMDKHTCDGVNAL